MERRVTFVWASVLALLLAGSARAADFTLGFEPVGDNIPTDEGKVFGTPGQAFTWDVYPILTTANNTDEGGAQGWQISYAISGATGSLFTMKGVYVSLIYDEDVNQDGSLIVRHDPYEQHLFDASMFSKGHVAATLESDPNVKGAINWALFRSQEYAVLQPNGVARMGKFTLTAIVPETDCSDVRLYYINGLKSATSQPTDNGVTFKSVPIDFNGGLLQNEFTFQMCKIEPPKPTFIIAAVPQGGLPAASTDSPPVYPDTAATVEVEPGTDVTVPLEVMIITRNLEGEDGPQGWQLSLAVEPCFTAAQATLKGMIVNTLYFQDVNQDGSLIVRNDNYQQDLSAPDMFSKGANLATLDGNPEVKGAISWALFRSQEKMVLYGNAPPDRVLKLNLKVTIAEDESKTCKIYFIDKMKSATSQPTDNGITYNSQPIDFASGKLQKQDLILTVKGKSAPKVGSFVRGEANNDGKQDIADAVWIVYAALNDPNYPLPCKDAGDVNGNAIVEFLDAVEWINYQFMNGAPPAAPFPGCGIGTGATAESCPTGSTRCQ